MNGEATIDARELHAFLEVGRDFTNWIKKRIEKYGFEKGYDYLIIDSSNRAKITDGEYSPDRANISTDGVGRPRTEYVLTIDMAKEVAMVENNDRGREVRLYFIEVEKKFREARSMVIDIHDQAAVARLMVDAGQRLLAEVERANSAESRVARLVHNDNTFTTTQLAKELGMSSAQELNTALHNKGIIYKDARGVWMLYSEYSKCGFHNIKMKDVEGVMPVYYSEWTGVGRDFVLGLFTDHQLKLGL